MQQQLHESTKSGYPKLISLKPWSQQNPIPFLNIQAWSKTVWFEMLRGNHQTQDGSHFARFAYRFLCLSLFLRFRAIIAIKRYGMKCNTFLYVSFVATSPYSTPSWHFYELHSQPFSQKQVKCAKSESQCSLFYVTSGLGPCAVDPQSWTKMVAFWPTLTTHGKSRI